MINIRKSNDRGNVDMGWLRSRHTFSFGHYHDPKYMGFGPLRVINEDVVAGGGGFPEHPHHDMEILSYVLEGALEHKDSMGNGSVIRPGDVQRMSAGTGVTHSEYNHSENESCHFLQIWFLPDGKGHAPGYEQKNFAAEDKRSKLKLVASNSGRNGSLRLNQDVDFYASLLSPAEKLNHEFAPGRIGWVQVASGTITLNGEVLNAGDGAAIRDEVDINIAAKTNSEIIFFDMTA
jgi:redox-sensitive bicupin YhaK (pirin superfamily)